MDVFWVIPSAIVGVVFVWALYTYLKRLPSSSITPNVLVHKASDKPAIDAAITESRDWSDRPCGSVLDAKSGKSLPTKTNA
jgi:hypothetical protein